MLRKISLSIIAGLSLTSAMAQDTTGATRPLTISGFVDVYYRFNFSNPKSADGTNNLTSFTNSQNSFELGMASVKLEHTSGKVGVVADLGYGTRADEFSYNESGIFSGDESNNSKFMIKQAYVTYAPKDN